MDLKCLNYDKASFKNCKSCEGYDMSCPSYDVDDVELVDEPIGESSGLERLFRRNGNKHVN